MEFMVTIKTVYGIEREVIFQSQFDALASLEIQVEAEILAKGESIVKIERVA